MRPGSHELVGASGRRYAVRFGVNVIVRIQDALGESIESGMGRVLVSRGRVDVKTLRVMVQHALEKPARPSLRFAGEVIDDVGVPAITGAISKEFAKKSETQSWEDNTRKLRLSAATLGVDTDRLWNLTLDDLAIEQEAASERLAFWRRLAVTTAWHVVAFDRTKYLPDLDPILERMGARKAEQREPTGLERHYDVAMQKIRMKQLAERSQQKHAKK